MTAAAVLILPMFNALGHVVMCKWLLCVVQPTDPGSGVAVVCADGVCRLVRASTLEHGSDLSVHPRSHSMPATQSCESGATSISPAPESSRSVDGNLYDIQDGKHTA